MTNDTIDSGSDARIDNISRPDPSDPMRLQCRLLSEDEKQLVGELKRTHEDLWLKIDALDACRETFVAKTALEESCMWAIKSLTRSQDIERMTGDWE